MSHSIPILHCPKLIRDTADDFKDFMTPTEYRSFVAVLCAAVFGISGYCNINRFIQFSNSVSSIANFFDAARMWEKLNRRHRKRLLRLLKQIDKDPHRFMWVLDDTFLKHSGSQIWGAYWWKDHANGGSIFGHKLIVLGIADRKHKILIPVFWEVLHRDLTDLTDEKIPNVHEKGWEVALRLLDNALSLGFAKLVLSADIWFAAEEFFTALNKREIQYEFEIRSNRKVLQHKNKYINLRVDQYFENKLRTGVYTGNEVKYASESTVRFKDSKIRHKVVAVSNRKSLKETCFAYYITNVLKWNSSKVWGLARDRWTIEVQFRDLKQLFTLGKAAVQSRNAVETAISVAMIALTVIRLCQLDEGDAEEKPNKRLRSAGAIVQQIKSESYRQFFSKLVAFSDGKRILKTIQNRLSYKNLTNKPAEFRRSSILAMA